jgi:hypothetical protein
MARPDFWGPLLGEAFYLRIRAVEPSRMVTDLPGRFVLLPAGEGATRLLLREPAPSGLFARLAWDPMHSAMQQRLLRGIKERAEGRPLVPGGLRYAAQVGWIGAGVAVAGLFAAKRRWLPWGLLCALLVGPSLALAGDLQSALAGLLALGLPVLGFLAWGRGWLAPGVLVGAAVLLVLPLAPDSYTAFGLVFDGLGAGLVAWALARRSGTLPRTRSARALALS